MLKQRLESNWRKAERDWVDNCLMLSSQTSLAVVTVLLAAAMERQPLDDEVQEALRKITDYLSFPSRLHRLFSELLRSPSTMRRRRLAAVLVAGPTITGSDADRDRLDLLTEQLLEEDIVSDQRIVEYLRTHSDSGTNASSGENLAEFSALTRENRFGIAAPSAGSSIELDVDPLSLDRLTAAHCVARVGLSGMAVTTLGKFLWKHMDHEAIRAGMGTGGFERRRVTREKHLS